LYNIYRFKQNVPIHTDVNRKCCINIPFKNNSKSITRIYELEQLNSVHDSKRLIDSYTTDQDPVLEFELTRPILFNTTYPHAVELLEQGKRISMSWSISKKYTFYDIRKMLSES
jgi:hypothetical protein